MQFTIDGKSVEPICPVYPDDTIEALQGKLNVGPVYLYAKKRRTVSTRQLYGMFEGALVTRAQVRAVLGNLRHLDQEIYTYDDLVAMNLDPETLEGFQYPVEKEALEGLLETLQVTRDLTKATYTYHDFLELSLDGTYDMYVSLGQHTPAGVPVKPTYTGDAPSRPERKRVLLEYLPLVGNRIWGVTAASPTYLLKPSGPFVNLDSVRPASIVHAGFTQLRAVMDTRYNRAVPLEYAFRLLHATDAVKLMRLNAVEPRVRAYAPTKDASGNKVPATRTQLRAGRTGDSALTALLGPLTVTFFVTGAVEVQWAGLPHTPAELQELVATHVAPFLAALNSTLEWGVPDAPGEAYFPPVVLAEARILSSTLHILGPEMEGELRIPDGSLLWQVFASDGDNLVYKRVSNFNMYDSAQQILRREGVDAYPSLVRLGLSDAEAREALATFADSGARRTAVPGFPVEVQKKANGTLFVMTNVDQFGYVAEASRYITALFTKSEPDYVSEEDYISEEDQEGGGDANRKLSNDFFALSRLKTRAAVTNKTSKQCLKDKMPIALTPDEYAAIEADPTNPDAFNLVATKDGIANPPLFHNGTYFICPRYWDMAHKKGAPMSERRFREERHGDRLIGPEEDRAGYAPEGKDIYEFLQWHKNTTGRKYTLVSDPSYPLDPTYSWMRAAVSKKNPVPCCYASSHVPKDLPPTIPTRMQTAQTGLLKPGSRGAIPGAIATFLGKATWFRQGTETSTFLECLASFKDQSVGRLKADLQQRATVHFQTLQNGNLATHFATDASNEFRQASPLHNFLAYLGDTPDFTFLWDLVSYDYNLVIFNGDNDTGKVELICPTNYFSKRKFNPKKSTILMLKQAQGYEPIWQDKIVDGASVVLKQFQESNFLQKIRRLYETSCLPTRTYSTASEVAGVVPGPHLTHRGKVVGILGQCHIPCYPSAVENRPSMDVNEAPRLTPEKTRAYLTEIADRGVACRPRFQVVVGDRCVGLMTETHQFVACTAKAVLANLAWYDETFQHEWEYAAESGHDPHMIQASNRMLENRLYSACRTVLRRALKNRHLRAQTLAILSGNGPKAGRLYSLVTKALNAAVEFHAEIPTDLIGRWSGGRLNLLKKNLVTKRPNNYAARLADELERFPHLRAYLLNEQTMVDFVVHDIWDTEVLMSETQWAAYAPNAPHASLRYSLNSYDTIVKGTAVGFEVERVGQMRL